MSYSHRDNVTTPPFHHYGPHRTRAALPRGAARTLFTDALLLCSDVNPGRGVLHEIAGPIIINIYPQNLWRGIPEMSLFVIAQYMFVTVHEYTYSVRRAHRQWKRPENAWKSKRNFSRSPRILQVRKFHSNPVRAYFVGENWCY